MATSKLLQTPQITEIRGSTIRIAHPSIQNNLKTFVRAPIAAAATALSVADNNGLANGDYLLLGSVGHPQSEAIAINASVTAGTAITLASGLVFSHELSAQVTKINERGIKIYGAATNGGSGTLIASIDAITTPIADATMIQWNRPYTEYTLISTDTTYAYYFVKFTDGTTDSSASAYVPSTGVLHTAVESFIQQALDITDSKIDNKLLNHDMCVRWANDGQNYITQFVYQDPQSGKDKQKDWSWEAIEDKTSISLTQNENTYALSALTTAAKYPYSDKGIITVRIGKFRPLTKLRIDQFDDLLRNKPRTTVSTQPSVGATSIVLADTYELSESGSVYIGADLVTYTGNTQSTGTLTGIPASGTGSITITHPVGTVVWQNISPGLPEFYTIFNGSIVLDKPIHADYVGQKLKIRYFSTLSRLTLLSDTTTVPFTNVFHLYIASQIEKRKGNLEIAGAYMNDFMSQVKRNALADIIPQADSYTYFNYDDPLSAIQRENDSYDSYHSYN